MRTISPHSPHAHTNGRSSPLSSPPSTPTPAFRPRPRPPRPPSAPVPRSSPPPLRYPIHEPSDTSFAPSSPIRGQGAEKRKNAAAKAARQRERVRAAKGVEGEAQKEKVYEGVLKTLRQAKCNLGDLVVFVSDPKKYQGRSRFLGFFKRPQTVTTILRHWVSAGNRSLQGRRLAEEFMVEHVGHMVFNEGESVKKSGFLHTAKAIIGPCFALDFSMSKLHDRLKTHCPTFMFLLERFSTSASQMKRGISEKSKRRKDRILTTTALSCLGERSQRNNYMKLMLALYTYAEGARRQVISVLSHLGLTSSYTSLIGSRKSKKAREAELSEPNEEDDPGQADEDTASVGSESTDELSSSECEFEDDAVAEVVGKAGEDKDAGASGLDEEESGSEDSTADDEEWTDVDEVDGGNSVQPEDDNRPNEDTAGTVEQVEAETRRAENLLQADEDDGTESGYLNRLSAACRAAARREASSGLLGFVYDNINTVFRSAEQILGRKDSQENGTCATAFTLFNASLADMKTSELIHSFLEASPLSRDDFILTVEEEATLSTRLEHTVLRILVTYGGEDFAQYKNDVYVTTPTTSDKIADHRTKIFPLPAMPIDESSITGNAEVVTEIFRELGLPFDRPDFAETVKIIAGDQLSIARLRSLMANRIGHDQLAQTFLWAVFMPGLFHYKMAFTHGFMETHYGKTNTVRNPGSLAFHNTVLDRIPIILSSLPSFRTSRDLIFVSLYARVFHCLLLVSDTSSLADFAAKNVSFYRLKTYVRELLAKFANPSVARGLCREREREKMQQQSDDNSFKSTKGDEVFENAVYYLRDALTLRELNDAIKAGDSGRVVDVLKQCALMYRGMGRTKYAYEMMHLVHNLKYVWPEPLRKIVLQNWLVNPTGQKNAWVEIDLMQEHLNFWIKTIYQAHGSAASWDWLAMITPCIDILRRLAQRIHNELGSHQGVKHTSPDLRRDIDHLMDSLDEHRVYSVEHGRTIDEPACMVPNTVSAGLKQLDEPLKDYNQAFLRLQTRARGTPLIGGRYAPDAAVQHQQAHGTLDNEDISDQGGDDDSSESDDSEAPQSPEGSFSLETPEDVALDMDSSAP